MFLGKMKVVSSILIGMVLCILCTFTYTIASAATTNTPTQTELIQKLTAQLADLRLQLAQLTAQRSGQACLALSGDVSAGMTHSNVTGLQQFLLSQGYLTVAPTGYFGPLTGEAVKRFQSENGISSTGYVGAETRKRIQTITCGGTTSATTPAPTYTTPSYTYNTPTYAIPSYNTPTYTIPSFSAPNYQAPIYSEPPVTECSLLACPPTTPTPTPTPTPTHVPTSTIMSTVPVKIVHLYDIRRNSDNSIYTKGIDIRDAIEWVYIHHDGTESIYSTRLPGLSCTIQAVRKNTTCRIFEPDISIPRNKIKSAYMRLKDTDWYQIYPTTSILPVASISDSIEPKIYGHKFITPLTDRDSALLEISGKNLNKINYFRLYHKSGNVTYLDNLSVVSRSDSVVSVKISIPRFVSEVPDSVYIGMYYGTHDTSIPVDRAQDTVVLNNINEFKSFIQIRHEIFNKVTIKPPQVGKILRSPVITQITHKPINSDALHVEIDGTDFEVVKGYQKLVTLNERDSQNRPVTIIKDIFDASHFRTNKLTPEASTILIETKDQLARPGTVSAKIRFIFQDSAGAYFTKGWYNVYPVPSIAPILAPQL